MVSLKRLSTLCVALAAIGFAQMAFSDVLNDQGQVAAEVQCFGKTDDEISVLSIRTGFGQRTGAMELCDGDKCSVLEKVKLQVLNPRQIEIQCASCDVQSPLNTIGLLQLDHADAKGNETAYTLSAQFVRDPDLWGIALPTENALSCTFKTQQDPGSMFGSLDSSLMMNRRLVSDSEEDEEESGKDSAQPAEPISNNKLVVCIGEKGLIVRKSNLSSPLFDVYKGESLTINKNKGSKTRIIRNQKHEFVNVTFDRLDKSGWMSKTYIRPRENCGSITPAKAQPQPSPKDPKQIPKPKQPEKPAQAQPQPARIDRAESFSNSVCARSVILSATKKSVKKVWGNRSYGGGKCALGVRLSLQESRVGGISGGIGHAIDFKQRLTSFGFVDTGIRDVKKAPPGSVIVLDGPHTAKYLRTGRMSRPFGNYVGHVTIKGDDGFYYTDGKTPEVAIGWANDKNESKIRNVVAIMVPGESLARAYEGRCHQPMR